MTQQCVYVCVCVCVRERIVQFSVISSDGYFGSVSLVHPLSFLSGSSDYSRVSLLQLDEEAHRFSSDIRRLIREVHHVLCVEQCSSAACCRSRPGQLGPPWLCQGWRQGSRSALLAVPLKGNVGLLTPTYFVTVVFVILPKIIYLAASPPCCQSETS